MASPPQTQPVLIFRTAAGFGLLFSYILPPQPCYFFLDLRLLDNSVTFILSQIPFTWLNSVQTFSQEYSGKGRVRWWQLLYTVLPSWTKKSFTTMFKPLTVTFPSVTTSNLLAAGNHFWFENLAINCILPQSF